jgi:hypothetical protein
LDYYGGNINHLNVLLISQHTRASEGSWAVVHGHKYYHGREVELFQGYELIVNPFWTGYVIWHPKWRIKPEVRRAALTSHFLGLTRLDFFNPKPRKFEVELFNPQANYWVNWPVKFKGSVQK